MYLYFVSVFVYYEDFGMLHLIGLWMSHLLLHFLFSIVIFEKATFCFPLLIPPTFRSWPASVSCLENAAFYSLHSSLSSDLPSIHLDLACPCILTLYVPPPPCRMLLLLDCPFKSYIPRRLFFLRFVVYYPLVQRPLMFISDWGSLDKGNGSQVGKKNGYSWGMGMTILGLLGTFGFFLYLIFDRFFLLFLADS